MFSRPGIGDTQYYAVFDDTLEGPRQTGKQYTQDRYKILSLTYKKHAAFSSQSREVVPWYRAVRPSVTLGEQRRAMRMQMRVDPPFELSPKRVVLKQESGEPILTAMWRTRTSLWYEVQQAWIPVMGFVEPTLIQGRYLYQVDGDTREECSARQVIQMTERMRVQSMLQAPQMLMADETIRRGWTPDTAAPAIRAVSSRDQEAADFEEAIRRSLAPVRMPVRLPTIVSAAPRPSAPAPGAPAPPTPPAPASPFAPKYVLELLKQDAIQKGESCSITMTPFQECASITATSCFHLFETAAIQAWLRGHTTCPVCKQAVRGQLVV